MNNQQQPEEWRKERRLGMEQAVLVIPIPTGTPERKFAPEYLIALPGWAVDAILRDHELAQRFNHKLPAITQEERLASQANTIEQLWKKVDAAEADANTLRKVAASLIKEYGDFKNECCKERSQHYAKMDVLRRDAATFRTLVEEMTVRIRVRMEDLADWRKVSRAADKELLSRAEAALAAHKAPA